MKNNLDNESVQRNYKKVSDYIKSQLECIVRKPTPYIHYPYSSITADESIYGNSIFSWDNHHMSIRYAYADKPEFFRYLIENLLTYQKRNGFVPNCVNKERRPSNKNNKFHAQPFLMQGAFFYYRATNDVKWLKNTFGKLEKYIGYYENSMQVENKLFVWPETYMGGIDNDIVTTFFTPGSVVPADLCSRIYLEYKAAALIAKGLSLPAKYRSYMRKAELLKKTINSLLWNDEFESFTALDIETGKSIFKYEDKPLNEIGIGLFSFASCSNFIPLYAGIADKKSADAMIRKYILAPQHFYGEHGIRSLSKSSEYYNNAIWGNPPRFGNMKRLTNSNWQGPVWILNCYFVVNILINYGFLDEARDLTVKTIGTLARSLDSINSFAENYDAETGTPLYVKNFLSWNILADIMPYEIDNQRKRIITQLLNCNLP